MARRSATAAPDAPDLDKPATPPEEDPIDEAMSALAGAWTRPIADLRLIRVHDARSAQRSPVVCRLRPEAVEAGFEAITDVLGPGRWLLIPVGHDGRVGRTVQLPEVAGRPRPFRFNSPLYDGPDPADLRGEPWGPPDAPAQQPQAASAAPAQPAPDFVAQVNQFAAQVQERLAHLEHRANPAPVQAPAPSALEGDIVKMALTAALNRPSVMETMMPLVAAALPVVGDLAGRFIDAKATGGRGAFVAALADKFVDKVVNPLVRRFGGEPDEYEDEEETEDDDDAPTVPRTAPALPAS